MLPRLFACYDMDRINFNFREGRHNTCPLDRLFVTNAHSFVYEKSQLKKERSERDMGESC